MTSIVGASKWMHAYLDVHSHVLGWPSMLLLELTDLPPKAWR